MVLLRYSCLVMNKGGGGTDIVFRWGVGSVGEMLSSLASLGWLLLLLAPADAPLWLHNISTLLTSLPSKWPPFYFCLLFTEQAVSLAL